MEVIQSSNQLVACMRVQVSEPYRLVQVGLTRTCMRNFVVLHGLSIAAKMYDLE